MSCQVDPSEIIPDDIDDLFVVKKTPKNPYSLKSKNRLRRQAQENDAIGINWNKRTTASLSSKSRHIKTYETDVSPLGNGISGMKCFDKDTTILSNKYSLPKIVEKVERKKIHRTGRLCPLIHSPYRELLYNNAQNTTRRKYSYFFISNFSNYEQNS